MTVPAFSLPRSGLALLLGLSGPGRGTAAAAAQDSGPRTLGPSGLPLPRFASLASSEVNVRTGPSTDHPIRWVYARPGLPVRIVEESELWRRIEDPDGETGWAHSSLLSVRRTVMVTGAGRAGAAPLGRGRRPRGGPARAWRDRRAGSAARRDWCRIEVDGRARLAAARRRSGASRRRLDVSSGLGTGRWPRARCAADAHHHVDPVDHLARRRLGQAQ